MSRSDCPTSARVLLLPLALLFGALVVVVVGFVSSLPSLATWTSPPPPVLGAAGLATPAPGRAVVIEAPPVPNRVVGAGDQTLRLAGPVAGDLSLDPAAVRDLSVAFLTRQVFRGLVALDGDLQPVPELADRIEIDPSGLVYTFRLRAGAAFHDGRAITAADVVASFTRALDPTTVGGDPELVTASGALGDIVGAAALAAGEAPDLEGARALDPRTVELRLEAPRATFLAKLTAPTASIVDPRDPAGGSDWWRQPNGTGPFRLVSWEPDDGLVLERFSGFAPGPPALARVEVRLGVAASLPINLYQAGEIDVVAVPTWEIDRARAGVGGLTGDLQRVPQFSTAFIAFRGDVAPMDDRHVRRAIQLAFPRRVLAEVGLGGEVLVADGLLPPGLLGRVWPGDLRPPDLAAARREIEASRYGTGSAAPPLRIYGGGGGAAEALRAVVEGELGLRVEVIEVEWDDFGEGLSGGDFPAIELTWGADYPDPESFLWSLFAADSPDNATRFADPVYDDLLDRAAAALDPEQRAAFYEEAHRRLLATDLVLPLYHDVSSTLVAPSVHGLVVTPLGLLSLDDVWIGD